MQNGPAKVRVILLLLLLHCIAHLHVSGVITAGATRLCRGRVALSFHVVGKLPKYLNVTTRSLSDRPGADFDDLQVCLRQRPTRLYTCFL